MGRIPLRYLLVAVFVIQIVGAVGAVGWLSLANEQATIADLVNQLQISTAQRIEQHLQSYLNASQVINRVHRSNVQSGKLNPDDFADLQRYFWYQLKTQDQSNYFLYANQAGDFLGVERQDANDFVVRVRDRSTNGNWVVYQLNAAGDRTKILGTKKYDPRTRPFYKAAVKAGDSAWSPIYASFSRKIARVDAVTPIYTDTGELRGVFSTAGTLEQINKFLNSLEIGKSGEAFILERSGEIVASSTAELPFIKVGDAEKRLMATESHEPTIQTTSQEILHQFGKLSQIQAPKNFRFNRNNKPQLAYITPFRDSRGLDWLIVVVVPKADFMAQANLNRDRTIVLCVLAVGIAIATGIATARWVAHPIMRLNHAARALSKGSWKQITIEREDEVGQLASAFNQMAGQLQESFATLEQRVAERTNDLAAAEAELRMLFTAMNDLVIVFDRQGCFLKIVSSPNLLISPVESQLGKTVHEVLSQEQAEMYLYTIQQVLQTQQPTTLDYSLVIEDQEQWFLADVSPLPDGTVLWVARDITELKQSEAALRQSEILNRSLLNAIPDIMARISQDGIYLDFMPTKELTAVLSIDDTVGKSVYEILPRNIAQERLALVRQAIQTGETQFQEYQLLIQDKLQYEEARIVPCGEDAALLLIRDIGDRKRAEDALRVSEEKFSKAFSASPDSISISTLKDGRYIEVNEAFLKTFGFERPEVLGKTSIELGVWKNPADRQKMRQPLEEQGFVSNLEVTMQKKSGELLVALLSAEVVDLSGESCLLAVIRDISERARLEAERKQAEAALRQSEATNRAILAAIPDLLIRLRRDGTYLDYIPAKVGKRFSVQSSERLGKTIFDILPLEQATNQLHWVTQALATGECVTFEHQLVLDDYFYEEEVRIVPYGEDEVLLVARDITDRKQLERDLAQSQQFLDSIIETMPLAVFAKDVNNNFRYVLWNRTAEEVYSIPREQALGRNLYDLVDKQLADDLSAEHQPLIQQRQLVIQDEIFQSQFRGEIWQRIRKLPMVNAQGQVTHLLYIGEDVTEYKRLESELRKANAEMQALFAAMVDVVLVRDRQGKCLKVAPTNQLHLVRPAEELIGKTLHDVMPEPTANMILSKIQESLANQQPVNVEYSLMLEGNEVWLSTSISPLSEDTAMLVARDISDRKQAEEILRAEQLKSEALLLNILPEAIATRLKQDSGVIAESFEEVTILFADIVGFTQLSSQMQPIELVDLLNEIFSVFDQLTEFYGLEKIKTIGDAYMAVAGLPLPRQDHAQAIADMALTMQTVIEQIQANRGEPIQIRVGINTGVVIAGVIGKKKFIYDLWGDAVNIASRMESQGIPGEIQVTEATYVRLKNTYELEQRGTIPVKGRGEMMTYWLKGKKTTA